jgi:hypothetical protein
MNIKQNFWKQDHLLAGLLVWINKLHQYSDTTKHIILKTQKQRRTHL